MKKVNFQVKNKLGIQIYYAHLLFLLQVFYAHKCKLNIAI